MTLSSLQYGPSRILRIRTVPFNLCKGLVNLRSLASCFARGDRIDKRHQNSPLLVFVEHFQGKGLLISRIITNALRSLLCFAVFYMRYFLEVIDSPFNG